MDKNPRPDRREAFAKEQAELREKRILDALEKDGFDTPPDNIVLDALEVGSRENDDLFAQLEAELDAEVTLEMLAQLLFERTAELGSSGATPESRTTEITAVPFGRDGRGNISATLEVHGDGFAKGNIRIHPDQTDKALRPLNIIRDPQQGYWSGYETLNDQDELQALSDRGALDLVGIHWPTDLYDHGALRIHSLDYDDTEQPLAELVTLFREELAPHGTQFETTDQYVQYSFPQDGTEADRDKPSGKTVLGIHRVHYDIDKSELVIALKRSVYKRTLEGTVITIDMIAAVDEKGSIALTCELHDSVTNVRTTQTELHDKSTIILEMISSLNALVNNRVA